VTRLTVRLRFSTALGLVAALLCFASVCRPVAAAGPLTNVTVNGQPNGGAIVSLSFGSSAPRYQVVGGGTAQPSVLLSNTTVSTQVPPGFAGAGPVASVTVAQNGTSTRIALNLAAVTPVVVRAAGNVLFIDVSPINGQQGGQNFGQPPPPAAFAAVPGAQQTVIVFLKYADISEVAGVLVANANVATNDTFVPQQSNIGTSSVSTFGGGGGVGGFGGGGGGFNSVPQQQNFGGGTFGQQQGVAQRVSDNVAIDRRLNAIILTGTPDVVAALRETIDKLDVPVPSVLLETQIVELTDTAARNIGLDFSPDGSGIVVNGSSAGGGFISKTGGFPTGQLNFAGNLYAQISEGNGRVIATPRILAQSGQPASILTGDALPILTSIIVAGNTSTAAQQVNYVNVGVNLQIQPRVSSDGFVTSHIYSEVSSVTGYINTFPQISQRTASTIATVRDGQAIVIGGLLQDNEIRNLSRLPFISDIPLIGSFFRHVNTTKTQTNLYIIVTPHVVPVGTSGSPPPVGVPIREPKALPQSTPPPAPSTPGPSATRRPRH